MFKKFSGFLSLILTLTLASPSISFADQGDSDDFYQAIENQKENLVETILFSTDEEVNTMAAADLASLTAIAIDQARVWGDTILEGDYTSVGETTLTEVMGLYLNKKLVAYRITYSEEAYYTGSCDYDYENKETLEDCTSGHIQESTFVSPDFQTYVQDDYAEFFD